MAECDIDQLVDDGKCFQHLTEDQIQALVAQLLCNWLDTLP